MSSSLIHPRDALAQGVQTQILSACEHYAGSERFIRKAFELQRSMAGAFDLTIDLEDGAGVGQERAQLEQAISLLREHAQFTGRRGVRVHPVDHAAHREEVALLSQADAPRIEYMTLPKVESAAQVASVWNDIASRRGPSCSLKLHVLIESPAALHEVWEIAALPAVEVLDFGLMDFISAHGGALPAAAMRSPLQFEHPLVIQAKCQIAEAAAAHGKLAAHNVCVDLERPEQARADARIARECFGFLRMWSIHPKQIVPILAGMAPEQTEVDEASEILLEAQRQHWAPISIHGRLHDRGSYRYYWNLLERALVAGVTLRADVAQRFFA